MCLKHCSGNKDGGESSAHQFDAYEVMQSYKHSSYAFSMYSYMRTRGYITDSAFISSLGFTGYGVHELG